MMMVMMMMMMVLTIEGKDTIDERSLVKLDRSNSLC